MMDRRCVGLLLALGIIATLNTAVADDDEDRNMIRISLEQDLGQQLEVRFL